MPLLRSKGLSHLGAMAILEELSGGIGPRLAGSSNAAKAVEWARKKMVAIGLQNVRLLPCRVPHWVRGDTEKCLLCEDDRTANLTCCALGQSPATPYGGVRAKVVEVKSLAEAVHRSAEIKDHIVFFNRPFDPVLVSTFQAYERAGDQRFSGPALAAKLGAKAALVRSLTSDLDDTPHTGVTEFVPGDKRIPAAALSLTAADRLSAVLKGDSNAEVVLNLDCHTMPDADSFDVMGEIVGTKEPNEVVVLGGHLDSWDKGRGAHDDGAGVAHGLEALRLIHDLGWKPKRTIRVCLWMDEEQKGSGASAYLRFVQQGKQKPYAAIESDTGGFAPRNFGATATKEQMAKLAPFSPAFQSVELDHFIANGETGADIGPLGAMHTQLFGLEVESQRYFDYHHSDKDTIDKVNPRELELGAIAMAYLAWVLANQ